MKNTFALHYHIRSATMSPELVENAFKSFCATAGFEICEDADNQVVRTNLREGDVIYEIWENQGEDGPGVVDICRSEEERDMTLCALSYKEPKSRWVKRIVVDAQYLADMEN